ncbi:MAG: tRNA (guanosine(37)-N1)-methyltransferase TrmD [Leptospirales bacterium]
MVHSRTFVVITLFPEPVQAMLNYSILRRAQEKGLVTFSLWNLRDFGNGRYRSTDDYPYGGGAGMVLRPEPIFRAIRAVLSDLESNCLKGNSGDRDLSPRLIYPSPQGTVFTQEHAWSWAGDPRPVVFIAGHYEGIDERVMEAHSIEEWSIGDYVLTGGELPALSMIDAVVRLIPGVLSDPESIQNETFAGGGFDYPQYTRPPEFEGMEVPAVLRSGNHEKINSFRKEKAQEKLRKKRPDLLLGDSASCGEYGDGNS